MALVYLIKLEDAGVSGMNVEEAALRIWAVFWKGGGKSHVLSARLWKARDYSELQGLVTVRDPKLEEHCLEWYCWLLAFSRGRQIPSNSDSYEDWDAMSSHKKTLRYRVWARIWAMQNTALSLWKHLVLPTSERQSNGSAFFIRIWYSSTRSVTRRRCMCDLPHPHLYFQLKKIIYEPELQPTLQMIML